MKIKFLLISALFLSCAAPVFAQEGHVMWWHDASRNSDFTVEGVVTYDPTKYYELSPVNIDGKDKKYYWIVGNVKITKILYINKDSQHLESYQQYLKNLDKNFSVLIPAYLRKMYSTDSKPSSTLCPILGLDIPKETTILNLSEIYIFPILDLKLESVVPPENIGEAKALLAKRTNNFLGN